MLQRDGLPRIPGGVATVAVFTMAVGLWMMFTASTNPGSGPLRFAGFVVVVLAVAVLCEALGFIRLGFTPW